jgi:hypothetical protein
MKKNFILLTVVMLFFLVNAFGQPTQPGPPAAGNSSNCTIVGTGNVPLDQCPAQSTTFVSNFQGGTYNRGNNGNNLGDGAIWRFSNIGTIPVAGTIVNAEVTINSRLNAILTNMDDNTATDQAGGSVANFFAPVIAPDVSLNASDRRGYVQFTVSFFQGANNFTTPITINNLNFVSYDADGNFSGTPTQAWFRETRVAQSYSSGNPTVLASSPSELIAYSYTDPAATTWTGFAGGVYERTGISRCAEVASSFRYGTGVNGRSSITFRFGYDFKAGSGFNVGNPGRQYGARFGCYNFPNQSTLPIKLIDFTVTRSGNNALLNWNSSSEINTDHFEIERSYDGINFSAVGNKQAAGYSTTYISYQFIDPVNLSAGNIYYRLKTVDIDGKSNYSKIVVLRLSSSIVKDFTVYPNPFTGNLKLEINSDRETEVTIRISDALGQPVINRNILLQKGANVIVLSSELQTLKPGMHLMEIISEDGKQTQKIIKR